MFISIKYAKMDKARQKYLDVHIKCVPSQDGSSAQTLEMKFTNSGPAMPKVLISYTLLTDN